MPDSSPTGKLSYTDILTILTPSFICSNKPYSQYKPGQTTLDRDYYQHATAEQANGAKCLQNFQRFGSDYNRGVSNAVKPGDYKVPQKDANNLVEYEL